jgi:hypothetical protein
MTTIPSLLNTPNNPTGQTNGGNIGLYSNFIDSTKVIPYRALTVNSASYDTVGASKTIDHQQFNNKSINAWISDGTSGWIVYQVSAGPKTIKYIGIAGNAKVSSKAWPKDFHIAVSTARSLQSPNPEKDPSWSTVLNASCVQPSAHDWDQQAQWFDIPSVEKASYIKFTFDNSYRTGNVQISEFYALGPLGGNTEKHFTPTSGLRIIGEKAHQ